MSQPQNELSLAKQKQNCPIHSLVDIEGFAKARKISPPLTLLLHKLVIMRGKYPFNISPEQDSHFTKAAGQFVGRSGITRQEAFGLFYTLNFILGLYKQKLN